jgi:DNA-binding PucR family transcriptional regulator
MPAEFQQLVDGLARRLARTVAIDDQEVRLVAYSSHEGVTIDALRQYSILNRRVPAEVAQYVQEHAAGKLAQFRLPPAPALGLEQARVCFPICQVGTVLGWLILLEGEGPLEQPDLEIAAEGAHAAALLFQRDQLAEELSRSRIRELVPRLIGDDRVGQGQAALALIDADLFAAGQPVAALVTTMHPGSRILDDAERTNLEGVLEKSGRRLTARRHLHLVRPDHGVLLVATSDLSIVSGGIAAVAQWLVDAIDRDAGNSGLAYVGIGEAVDGLESVALSYQQAMRAVDVGRVVGRLGRVVAYSDLGIYALLSRIPPGDLTREAIPPKARRLLDLDETGRVLVSTLEEFLERAGNVKATADALGVHRATLYYRLGRVEQVTGADLECGEDRLTLHLGLRMARMAGLLG